MWGRVSAPENTVSSRRPLVLAAFALAVAFIALAAVTLLARRTFDRLQRGSEARQEAYEVLIALRRLRQDVGEMRVGVTGYVLTRDSVYLATYRSGLNGIARDTAAIRQLTRNAPTLQQERDRLQLALRAYVDDFAATMRVAESRPSATMTAVTAPSRSGMLIEAIRPHFVALENEQLRLLEASALEVQRAVTRTNSIFTWVLVVGAILISATGVLLFVHLREREHAEARLARAQAQLHESQRLEAVGQLAAGVAHDFNNILTVIMTVSDLVHESLPAGHASRSDLALVRDAARQGADLTRQLLAFGRRQVFELRVLDPNVVVSHFRSMLDRVIPENIEVRLHLADDLGRVRADAGQLEQILMNLAVNARDATTDGGRLTIETANAELDLAATSLRPDVKPGRYVVLTVSDTGAGMDEATRARVFEPFFTTKQVGKGTGLGLATVYGIVRQSGGHIWVYSEPSRGSTFKVYLPRVDEAPTPERPMSLTKLDLPAGSETILVVEDDDRVRQVTGRILTDAGYRVLAAARPEAALELLSQRRGPVHLLLTDVVLPGMSGPQLARRVVALVPGIRVLYQSGYSDAAIVHHGALDTGAALLPKPFTASALKQRVRDVLDSQTPTP